MKKGLLIAALATLLPAVGLQAQNTGFYAVGGGYFQYNNKEVLFPKVQVFKPEQVNDGVKEIDQCKRGLGLSLDLGYMFTDKGKGPLRAIEIGVGYEYTDTRYNDDNMYVRQDYYDYKVDIYDTRTVYYGVQASYIRRMYFGKGFIAEPTISFGYGKLTPAEYREQASDWFSQTEVTTTAITFVPLLFEYRSQKNAHYGFRIGIGSIRYMRCKPEDQDPYKVLNVNLNQFCTSLVYYL